MTNTLDVPGIKETGFEVSANYENQAVRLSFRGSAELQVSDQLGPFLTRVHEEALRLGAREVTADLVKLEFMNSSSFKRFVTWLNVLRDVQGPSRYSIRFLSSPRVRWQKASLMALSCFAPGLVTVETQDAT
ncbi:MAG TPA: hypothetical protein VF815_38215 [Myxococcaceae bacterium]|jgi:hypothetical protein